MLIFCILQQLVRDWERLSAVVGASSDEQQDISAPLPAMPKEYSSPPQK
jgi:hypothetical protein